MTDRIIIRDSVAVAGEVSGPTGPAELLSLPISRHLPWSGWWQGGQEIIATSFGGRQLGPFSAMAPAATSPEVGEPGEPLLLSPSSQDLMLGIEGLMVGLAGPTGKDSWIVGVAPFWGNASTNETGLGGNTPGFGAASFSINELVTNQLPTPEIINAAITAHAIPMPERPAGFDILFGLVVVVIDPDTETPVFLGPTPSEQVQGLFFMNTRVSVYEGTTAAVPVTSAKNLVGLNKPRLESSLWSEQWGGDSDVHTLKVGPAVINFYRFNSPTPADLLSGIEPAGVVGIETDLSKDTEAGDGDDRYRLRIGPTRTTWEPQHPADLATKRYVDSKGGQSPWTDAELAFESNELSTVDDVPQLNITGNNMVTKLNLRPGAPVVNINFPNPGAGGYKSYTIAITNLLMEEAADAAITYVPNTTEVVPAQPGKVRGGITVYRADVFGIDADTSQAYMTAVYTSEGDAGRMLYAGNYDGSDIGETVAGVHDHDAQGDWDVPLVNVADASFDVGWINFTATTPWVKVVMQGFVWTSEADPGPADDVLQFGAQLQWSLAAAPGSPGEAFPSGNPRTVVINSKERTKRQLEIIIPVTPGVSYRWKWRHLLSNAAGGYSGFGSRFLTELAVYAV